MHHRVCCAGLGIVGAIYQSANSCMHHCPGAHRTRFDGGEKFTIAETIISDCGTGFAQSDDLSVSAWVRIRNIAIETAPNNLSVLNNYRANWNFADSERALGSA